MKKIVCMLMVIACLFSFAFAEDFKGTTVRFFLNDGGKIIAYEGEGHSGYASAGYDIVCAGISALTQTTLMGLVNVLGLPVDYTIGETGGYISVALADNATDEQVEQAQVLMLTLCEGLNSIAYSYPGNLQIIFEDET